MYADPIFREEEVTVIKKIVTGLDVGLTVEDMEQIAADLHNSDRGLSPASEKLLEAINAALRTR